MKWINIPEEAESGGLHVQGESVCVCVCVCVCCVCVQTDSLGRSECTTAYSFKQCLSSSVSSTHSCFEF